MVHRDQRTCNFTPTIREQFCTLVLCGCACVCINWQALKPTRCNNSSLCSGSDQVLAASRAEVRGCCRSTPSRMPAMLYCRRKRSSEHVVGRTAYRRENCNVGVRSRSWLAAYVSVFVCIRFSVECCSCFVVLISFTCQATWPVRAVQHHAEGIQVQRSCPWVGPVHPRRSTTTFIGLPSEMCRHCAERESVSPGFLVDYCPLDRHWRNVAHSLPHSFTCPCFSFMHVSLMHRHLCRTCLPPTATGWTQGRSQQQLHASWRLHTPRNSPRRSSCAGEKMR